MEYQSLIDFQVAQKSIYICIGWQQKQRNPFTGELLFWAVVMVIHKSKFINPAQRSGDI